MTTIGNKYITIEEYNNILLKNEKVELNPEAVERVDQSYQFLKVFSQSKVIYGINTCFGPMAPYKISNHQQKELQYNLIRSHCSGVGEILPEIYIRSAMISRLNTLMRGYSGIHKDVVELLANFINLGISPVIYEHGGVGASGDLVQLAHIALALIGEGNVIYKGKIVPAKQAFDENNLKPLEIYIREGLGLMNGTSVMSGIGILNLIHAKNLIDWSIVITALMTEICEAYDDFYSVQLNKVKYHSGQNKIAEFIRNILSDSKLTRKREEHLFDNNNEQEVMKDKIQEYYSIRCVPQIIGVIFETHQQAQTCLVNEINSVNDNPIVDFESKNVYHGGNFHGDYVSFEMDKLKIAITKLTMLMERQINFLMNNNINGKLPPFVNLGVLGLNLGMQGVQFTATSTTAESQTLSFPMYVHSIPNNNDNQDIVSMGANSALIAKKVIENGYQVAAIELISIIQAIDYLGFQDKMSSFNLAIYQELRKIVPKFIEDTPKYNDIKNIRDYLFNKSINL